MTWSESGDFEIRDEADAGANPSQPGIYKRAELSSSLCSLWHRHSFSPASQYQEQDHHLNQTWHIGKMKLKLRMLGKM
jgi:hypothetical protein